MRSLVTWDDIRQMRREGVPFLLVDVREAEEVMLGAVSGSRHIPLAQLEQYAPMVLPDKDQPIVCLCLTGRRSAVAVRRLQALGYTNVANVSGGYEALPEVDTEHKI